MTTLTRAKNCKHLGFKIIYPVLLDVLLNGNDEDLKYVFEESMYKPNQLYFALKKMRFKHSNRFDYVIMYIYETLHLSLRGVIKSRLVNYIEEMLMLE